MLCRMSQTSLPDRLARQPGVARSRPKVDSERIALARTYLMWVSTLLRDEKLQVRKVENKIPIGMEWATVE